MKIAKELVNLMTILVEFLEIKEKKLLNYFAPMLTRGRIETGSKEWSPRKWVFEYEQLPSKNSWEIVMDIIIRNGRALIAQGDIAYNVHTGQLGECHIENQNCSLKRIMLYITHVVNMFGQMNAIDRDAEVMRKFCTPRTAIANGWASEHDFVEDTTKKLDISNVKIVYTQTKQGNSKGINYVKKEWPVRGGYATRNGKKVYIPPRMGHRKPELLAQTEKRKEEMAKSMK